MSKPFFNALLLAVSAHCAYRAWTGYAIVCAGRQFHAGLLRLRMLEVRGTVAVSRPLSLGLLRGGCKVARRPCGSKAGESQCSVDWGGVLADGYFFEVERGLQPSRWVVEASNDNGTSWTTVGASTWRLSSGGSPEFFPHLPDVQIAASEARDGSVEVVRDLRTPLGWVLLNVILFVSNSITTLACWLVCCLGSNRAFRFCFNSIYALAWLTLTLSAASYGWQGIWREAFSTWLRGGVRAICTFLIISSDSWLMPIVIFLGIADYTISILTELVIHSPLNMANIKK